MYADNPKYLFEYIYLNHPEIEAIWLTRNQGVAKELRSRGMKVCRLGSVIELWYSLRAVVGVTSHGLNDINRYASGKINLVETWHGIPLKPVLLADPKQQAKKKRKRLRQLSLIFPFLRRGNDFENYFAICGSSTFSNHLLKKAFGVNAPVIDLGFPRLDGLFSPLLNLDVSKSILRYQSSGKKVGIYMPTYRRKGEFDVVRYFIENSIQIDENLSKQNCVLFVRIHPFEMSKFPDDLKFRSIHLLSNEDICDDIYSVLGLYDFLITDYSSILFDFAIMSRPIFMLIPDKPSYIASNGEFLLDLEELNLPISENWHELLKRMNEILRNEKKELLFNEFGSLIHTTKDGNNSNRLFKYIRSNIELL